MTFFINKIEFDFYQNFFGIILLTITALLGQYFNSESYKYGKANTVVILSYSRIVFSTLLGFFFLSEKVSFITMIGILLIVLTTYFVKKKIKDKENDFHHLFFLSDLKVRLTTLY